VRLLVYEPAYQRVAAEIAEIAPGLELVRLTPDGNLSLDNCSLTPVEAAVDIAWASSDVYAGNEQSRAFMIAALKSENLRWLQSAAAGFDHSIFTKLHANGVRLTKSDQAAEAIAEYVLAAVFECFHNVGERRQAQQDGDWRRITFREIAGSRWAVVGMGNIGRAVTSRARALGADVTGVRRSITGDEPADRMIRPEVLASILPTCDVVVLSAASNSDSHHLVDCDFLAAMKADAVLVNIARGALIDEAALLASLDAGRPGHAVLDVFESEPLAKESSFWQHPKVLVSAHCAAASSATRIRGDQVFIDNLRRFIAGDPLRHEVSDTELHEVVQGNSDARPD
jgi:phosphoglycerate dehydrogenase-like enzyme